MKLWTEEEQYKHKSSKQAKGTLHFRVTKPLKAALKSPKMTADKNSNKEVKFITAKLQSTQ